MKIVKIPFHLIVTVAFSAMLAHSLVLYFNNNNNNKQYEESFKDFDSVSSLITNHIKKYTVSKFNIESITKIRSYNKLSDNNNKVSSYVVKGSNINYFVVVVFYKNKAKIKKLTIIK